MDGENSPENEYSKLERISQLLKCAEKECFTKYELFINKRLGVQESDCRSAAHNRDSIRKQLAEAVRLYVERHFIQNTKRDEYLAQIAQITNAEFENLKNILYERCDAEILLKYLKTQCDLTDNAFVSLWVPPVEKLKKSFVYHLKKEQ